MNTRSRTYGARTIRRSLIAAAASLTFAGFVGAVALAETTPPTPPTTSAPTSAVGSASQAVQAAVPGDNGTVKVHRSTTSADDPRNEPHVCTFYLVGFHFDAGQQITWKILSWPPTGDRTEVLNGTLTLDQTGHGRTEDLNLPDGHYKLFWNFDGENGIAKHKVFWVECQTSTPTESPTPTPTPTETPTESPTTPTTPTPPTTPAPTPSPVTGNLPVTG